MVPAYTRYLDANGVTHPLTPSPRLMTAVHNLFGHWMYSNGHPLDFAAELDHDNSLLYLEWVTSGRPDERGIAYKLPCLPLSPFKAWDAPPQRFYLDNGSLNMAVHSSRYKAALSEHFKAWCSAGFAPMNYRPPSASRR